LTGIVALALAVLPASLPAAEPVSLELVLAVDGSNSVSDEEFALQLGGLALAFLDPEVVQAVEAHMTQGLAVALVQWSNATDQAVSVPWRRLRSGADCWQLAADLRRVTRQVRGGTAISGALDFGRRMIDGNAFEGRRKAIDVSGDGPDLHQVHTRQARDRAVADGITVNGLVILDDNERLETFYRSHVIGGDRAFVMSANSFADYAAAIREKLLRELGVPRIAARPPPLRARLRPGMTESAPRS